MIELFDGFVYCLLCKIGDSGKTRKNEISKINWFTEKDRYLNVMTRNSKKGKRLFGASYK